MTETYTVDSCCIPSSPVRKAHRVLIPRTSHRLLYYIILMYLYISIDVTSIT